MEGKKQYKNWKSLENRIAAVKQLVDKSGKLPQEITQSDFNKNHLSGILYYYDKSPYLALKEAGLANFEKWEMESRVGNSYWRDKNERIRAIKWLIGKTGKPPQEITQSDFNKNHLAGLLVGYYNSSPHLALKEAGLANFERWEARGGVGKKYWEDKNERVRAIKWLIDKIGKEPKEITQKDFYKNKLLGLLSKCYDNSPYLALKEAGLANFEKWEMKGGVGNWRDKEERIRAIEWLIDKTGKEPKETIADDFNKNHLSGLLSMHYNGSPYLALKEAGLANFEKWEMESRVGSWEDKDERIRAIKWLVDKTGKQPKEIVGDDFEENYLPGILRHYDHSPYLALKEAGLANFEKWEMKGGGSWEDKNERIRAIKWLVDKIKKKPKEIIQRDFNENNLSGLLATHYNSSPYLALKKAGYDVAPANHSKYDSNGNEKISKKEMLTKIFEEYVKQNGG